MVIWKSVSLSGCQPRHYKTFLSALKYFLCKKANVYGQFTSIFFLVLSLSESLSFCYNYSFLCHYLFIQPEASFSIEHSIKTTLVEFLLSTLASLSRSFPKTSQGRNFSCYFSKNWLHHRRSPNNLRNSLKAHRKHLRWNQFLRYLVDRFRKL